LRKGIWGKYVEGMEPVVIFRTFDLAEAQLLRSRLEAAGLDATVTHENSAANLDVPGGGVRVVVPEDQAAEARELIENAQDEQ
jgi:hypothetical protein